MTFQKALTYVANAKSMSWDRVSELDVLEALEGRETELLNIIERNKVKYKALQERAKVLKKDRDTYKARSEAKPRHRKDPSSMADAYADFLRHL